MKTGGRVRTRRLTLPSSWRERPLDGTILPPQQGRETSVGIFDARPISRSCVEDRNPLLVQNNVMVLGSLAT